MKGVRNSLMVFAASVVMTGISPAQDAFTWFNRASRTNSGAGVAWGIKTEPKVELGSNLWLTGLLVDCSQPAQAWTMLKSPVPVGEAQTTLAPSELPLTVPRPVSNPEDVHRPDFVLLRLSFP